MVKPADIASQVPWDQFEAVAIVCLSPEGKRNKLYMSTMTVDELSFLTQQLQSHTACVLGPLEEG